MSLPANTQSQPGKVRLSLKVKPSFSIFSESITNFPREPSIHVIQAMPKKIPFFYERLRIEFQENPYIYINSLSLPTISSISTLFYIYIYI